MHRPAPADCGACRGNRAGWALLPKGCSGCISGWCEGAGDYHVPDDEYFVYGDAQDCGSVRNEYLPDVLLISDSGWAHQDYFFLNPRIILEDGEWEAWHFSPDFPGAYRYQSFGLLMCSEYSILKRR